MRTLIGIALELSREMHTLKVILKLRQQMLLHPLIHQWIETTQVTSELKISKRTLQKLRDQRILPFTLMGGKIFYKMADLMSLLEANYAVKRKKS